MKAAQRISFKKELLIIAILLVAINFSAIFSEQLPLVKWSRLGSSFSVLIYLLSRHQLYLNKRYLIGFIGIPIADLCLVYFDIFSISVFYLVLTVLVQVLFLWRIFKIIIWKDVAFLTISLLTISTAFNTYVLDYLLRSLVDYVDPLQLLFFYIYGGFGLLFSAIAGIGYLQLDRTGNEHYIIGSYGYLISNAFLVVAIFTEYHWFYYLSRAFYIIVLLSLSYSIIVKLKQDSSPETSEETEELVEK